jgi:DNA/RNA-binding domain of Phe-tRNA-synthetase-like protein
VSDEPEVRRGLVAPELAEEHPGLWVAWTDVAAAPARTPPELRERLRALADRMRGAQAIALRSRDVPHAYRVFFRHVGLDPDVVRTPVEDVALRRMADGGLRPLGLIEDALTVAVLETGVGMLALDADRLIGAPGLRADAGGRIVLADEAGELGVLFGATGERAAIDRATRRVALVAIGVPNVPDVFVEEALWTAWDILR